MKKKALVRIVAASLIGIGVAGCTFEENAIKTAKREGWTDVTVIDSEEGYKDGYTSRNCMHDERAYRIKGIDHYGKQKEGFVCCSFVRGCRMWKHY